MMYQSSERQTMMYKLIVSERDEMRELKQKLAKTGCLEELKQLGELLARYNGQPDPMLIKGPNNLDRREIPVNDDWFVVLHRV